MNEAQTAYICWDFLKCGAFYHKWQKKESIWFSGEKTSYQNVQKATTNILYHCADVDIYRIHIYRIHGPDGSLR